MKENKIRKIDVFLKSISCQVFPIWQTARVQVSVVSVGNRFGVSISRVNPFLHELVYRFQNENNNDFGDNQIINQWRQDLRAEPSR